MVAFLLDEALATRLTVEQLNAAKPRRRSLPGGQVYEDVSAVPTPGPVAMGPAAHLLGAA